MPLLEAFLALALTMLSLAMIATLVVEFVHRLLNTRAKNLKTMLGEFYDSELKDIVDTELKKGVKELEGKAEFVRKLVTNPLMKEKEGEKLGPIKKSLKDLGSLSTEDLFKRLAYTSIGKQIKAQAEAEIDEAVESLSRSYDAFGAAATDLFKRKAQIVSLVAGILVAFGLNVNALLIFEQYLDDPVSRAKTVAQADAALENFTKRTENTEQFKDNKEVAAHLDSIKDGIKGLEDSGITIGYSSDTAPASRPRNPTLPRWLEIVFWASGVLGTGLLIGLGGPFWFNVVRKLTEVLKVARGGAQTATEPSDSTTVPTDPMKSHKDTFKMANKPPPLVKAQANLTAAAKAATDADKAVKAAADAMLGTQVAAEKSADERMKAAVKDAETALTMATDAQKNAYEDKRVAEQSMQDANAKRAKPAGA